jgi:hypothetical protein
MASTGEMGHFNIVAADLPRQLFTRHVFYAPSAVQADYSDSKA